MNVLFTASESYPLLKTGGLGDVVYSLPHALSGLGLDVRVLLPGYRDILSQLDDIQIIGWLTVQGAGRTHDVRILSASHPGFRLRLWIVDCAELFDRPGNPYLHPDGYDCGLLGGLGAGCAGPSATLPVTWGLLKGLFRDTDEE